ncbi:MAG: M23 family metallopeptidase [Candidatus Moranbacteria bacterium]|nr:M23 family metallopeptidase [Candidatus Moranbacteria bacterium]
MKAKLFLAVFCGMMFFGATQSNAEMVLHKNYWVYPMDRKPTKYEWNESWYSYSVHIGHDYMQPAGYTVRAIADGVIEDHNDSLGFYGGWDGASGSAILVKHKTSTGRVFYAVYGHNKLQGCLDTGDKVKAGEVIGHTHVYFGDGGKRADHIHFGIRPDEKDSKAFRGRCSAADDCGWVHPDEFLNDNFPEMKFINVYEPARMFFDEDDFDFGWWPSNVTCINAEAWARDKKIVKNANESICREAFDDLEGRFLFGDQYGFIDMWQGAFFGDDMNIGTLQCIAR